MLLTVAGVAVLGDLGWSKLGERREEKTILYGRKQSLMRTN